jgi:dipeptidyl aminopeptidase/acylaminoacyl peptidase
MIVRLLVLSLLLAGAAIVAGCAGTGPGSQPTTTVDLGSVQVEAASGLTRLVVPSPAMTPITFTGLYGATITRVSQVGSGAIAYFSDRASPGSMDIFAVTPDGGVPFRLTSSAGDDDSPAWSPDGTKIAFVSSRAGNREIYVMSASGANQTRLTYAAGDDSKPTWSPDGTKIAFSSDRTGNREIWVMASDGSAQKDLTNSPATLDGEPAWSPDGRRIAYSSLGTTAYDIWTMYADGTGKQQITDDPGHDMQPAWSPDSKRIAFTSSRNSGYDIWLMDADGWNQYPITGGSAQSDTWPEWSPDGSQVAFRRQRNGLPCDIWVVDIDANNAHNVTNDPVGNDQGPSWYRGTRVVRTLIGPAGADSGYDPALGATRPFVLLGLNAKGLTCAVTVAAPAAAWRSLTASGLTNTGNQLVGVQVEASQLDGVLEDTGRGAAPRLWATTGTPTTKSILILLAAATGKVTAVIGSGATAYATSAGAPSPRLEGDSVVLDGRFGSVASAEEPGTNLAPNGAARVVLSASTGQVVSVTP